MFCPKCGKQLPEDARYCNRCGEPVIRYGAGRGEEYRSNSGYDTGSYGAEKYSDSNGNGNGNRNSGNRRIVVIIIAVIAVIVVILALFLLLRGNSGESGEIAAESFSTAVQAVSGTEEPAAEEEAVVRVDFSKQTEGYEEYALITAYDADGSVLWTRETVHYEATELSAVGEIGIYNDVYYYYEGGEIVTLNLQDGSELWINGDFGGASATWAFDTDGTLYISGYYGPMLAAYDTDGNTVQKLESADGYMWPSGLEIRGDVIKIDVTTEDSTGRETTIYVRKSDFSVLTEDEPADDSADDSAEEDSGTEDDVSSVTLPDLPTLNFSSGMGVWYTSLTLNSDGTFTGHYSDSDMGDRTEYISDFSGFFTDIQQESQYVYIMQLGSYDTEKEPDTEETDGDTIYKYVEPYGIEGGVTFRLILSGGDVSAEGEDVLRWVNSVAGTDLSDVYVLVNESTQQAFAGSFR